MHPHAAHALPANLLLVAASSAAATSTGGTSGGHGGPVTAAGPASSISGPSPAATRIATSAERAATAAAAASTGRRPTSSALWCGPTALLAPSGRLWTETWDIWLRMALAAAPPGLPDHPASAKGCNKGGRHSHCSVEPVEVLKDSQAVKSRPQSSCLGGCSRVANLCSHLHSSHPSKLARLHETMLCVQER